MIWSDKLRKNRLVAIKNFNDELYRMVKAYASLEGRTISSIFEEAIRLWIGSRKDYVRILYTPDHRILCEHACDVQ